MATKFSPCKGSYVLNQFPSNVMFGMNGFHVSASGAIQGHHGPLVFFFPPKCWKSRLAFSNSELQVASKFMGILNPAADVKFKIINNKQKRSVSG